MRVIFRRGQYFCDVGMIPVAPRIVLDVSCVTRINHESDFLWQGAIFRDVGEWVVPYHGAGDFKIPLHNTDRGLFQADGRNAALQEQFCAGPKHCELLTQVHEIGRLWRSHNGEHVWQIEKCGILGNLR